MRRQIVAVAVAVGAVLAVASPAAAYTPPETDPRVVFATDQGNILIALTPENAPKHVAQFLAALAAGDFQTTTVIRVEPDYYVQMAGAGSSVQLAGLPVERNKIGNVRGALSVYDSGKPGDIPTLTLVLTNSPQLDTDYTTIGLVEAGKHVAKLIANTPTGTDHVPTTSIVVKNIHIATMEERAVLREAEKSSMSGDGTAMLAAMFVVACAAFLAALISAFHEQLGRQRTTSLALLVVLLAFFAVWVAIGGSDHSSGLVGVALFGGAIGMFRLMGKFEKPAPPPDPHKAPPPAPPARKLHPEHPELRFPRSNFDLADLLATDIGASQT